jgi:D-alanine-D-alanine ligase
MPTTPAKTEAQPPRRRLRVAVLYGGRSGEHEISLRSAASVLRNLDQERFEAVPIAIDKEGRWHPGNVAMIEAGAATLPVFRDQPPVLMPPSPAAAGAELVPYGAAQRGTAVDAPLPPVDVVFPVMHGTLCEDGTIQGLLELADVPYVGCGVLASAVGMDKEVAKRLAQAAGLPIVPYALARSATWERELPALAARVASELGYPCFVKPSSCGSSVGVHKVRSAAALGPALADAFRYDRKVLIEKAVDAREIEVAVLENPEAGGPPLCSVPGEINPRHEFYSYEAKYLDENGAELVIPARLMPAEVARAQELAAAAFTTLECEGMARVDFFLDRKTGALYFNEVNTIPGFTSISMYPKMWEATGLPYRDLLSRLIDLALRRGHEKRALVRDYASK